MLATPHRQVSQLKQIAPAHCVGAGILPFVLRSWRDAQTAIVVLSHSKDLRMAVPADNEATRICLCPEVFSLSLPSLGGGCSLCQTAKIFLLAVRALFLAASVALVAVSKERCQ